MPKGYSSKSKKKGGKFTKHPHEIGAAGKRFQPSTFGTDRGTEKSWVSKLPKP